MEEKINNGLDKIVTPGLKKVSRFKVRLNWKNGSNETIYSIAAPNVNPALPMFMSFRIKDGCERLVALMEVRAMDIEVETENTPNLII